MEKNYHYFTYIKITHNLKSVLKLCFKSTLFKSFLINKVLIFKILNKCISIKTLKNYNNKNLFYDIGYLLFKVLIK